MPKAVPSSSMPTALVKSPLPSARNRIVPSAPLAFPQAVSTWMSLTATQAMVSMPRARNASACWMKPGMCFRWQVGVNAPGTANSTTRFPRKISATLRFSGPLAPMVTKVASGSRSPILIDMDFLSRSADDQRPYHAPPARNHRQRQRLADQRVRLLEPEHRQAEASGIEPLRRPEIEIGIALDENVGRRRLAHPLEPHHQLVAFPLASRLQLCLPDIEPSTHRRRNLGQPVEHELPIGGSGR